MDTILSPFVQNRKCLFGTISNGIMILNEVGKMMSALCKNQAIMYSNLNVDEFIIMPNHIHGIIQIHNNDLYNIVEAGPCADLIVGTGPCGGPLSIPEIIRNFKSITTNKYIHGVKNLGWRSFEKSLWQRNYYEHVIRNENALNQIRQYIIDNPMNWDTDKENPFYSEKEKLIT